MKTTYNICMYAIFLFFISFISAYINNRGNNYVVDSANVIKNIEENKEIYKKEKIINFMYDDSNKVTESIEDRRTTERINTARIINEKGYGLLQEGKYKEALQEFKNAYEVDSECFLAYYNYASTLAILIKLDYIKGDNYIEEIIDHLVKVKRLNPEYINKIKTDSNLDLIRKHYKYYLLMGLSPYETEDVKIILSNLSWYIPGNKEFSYVGGAEFGEHGEFYLWYYSTNYFKKSELLSSKIEVKGRYEVSKSNITIYLDKKMLRKRSLEDIFKNDSRKEMETVLKGVLKDDGRIKMEVFEYDLIYSCFELSM